MALSRSLSLLAMATGEPSTPESQTANADADAKRPRKQNVRLADLGEAKPSAKGGSPNKRRSATPSPETGNPTDTPASGTKLSKRKRASPVDNSGAENQKKKRGSESKSPKRLKHTSTKTTGDNTGPENTQETPGSASGAKLSKRIRTKSPVDNSGAKNQKKTPNSETKVPKRLKRTSLKTPTDNAEMGKQTITPASGSKRVCTNPSAENSGEYEPETNQNGGTRLAEMGGVHGWLNQLGLGRYTHVFDKHEVDEEVLCNITMNDLKEMGISAVGSRRKLYCAIRKLK